MTQYLLINDTYNYILKLRKIFGFFKDLEFSPSTLPHYGCNVLLFDSPRSLLLKSLNDAFIVVCHLFKGQALSFV